MALPLVHPGPSMIVQKQPADTAAVKSTIQRELSAMDFAYAHKDLKASYRFFSADFARKGSDGKTYRVADDLAGAKVMMNAMQSVNARNHVAAITVSGGVANATVTVHAILNLLDTDSTPPAIEHIEDDEIRNQVWVKSGANWMMLSSATGASTVRIYESGKLLQTIVNGKVVKPAAVH